MKKKITDRGDHTPGPWERVTEHPVMPGKIRAGSCTLAEVTGLGPQACANANLMAASPDMLSALKEVLAQSRMQQGGVFVLSSGAWHLVNDAIAKAEKKS